MTDPAVPADALTPTTYPLAVERLSAADPVLAGVVERWGPPPFWRHPTGFSRQKAAYARGLAEASASGTLDLAELDTAPDAEVRRALLRVRGIGRWTADVYLLFALRRADAWPSGDLGLAVAVQELWGQPTRLGWDALDAFAERWRPQRAVAARFLAS